MIARRTWARFFIRAFFHWLAFFWAILLICTHIMFHVLYEWKRTLYVRLTHTCGRTFTPCRTIIELLIAETISYLVSSWYFMKMKQKLTKQMPYLKTEWLNAWNLLHRCIFEMDLMNVHCMRYVQMAENQLETCFGRELDLCRGLINKTKFLRAFADTHGSNNIVCLFVCLWCLCFKRFGTVFSDSFLNGFSNSIFCFLNYVIDNNRWSLSTVNKNLTR